MSPLESVECPHWERPTNDGRCITRWWAGPPTTWVVGGVGAALGFALLGVVMSKLKIEAPEAFMARRNPGRRSRRKR
jgi:hypothetical protein